MGRIGIAVLGASAGRKGGVDVYASGLARALGVHGKKHQYTALTASDEFDCTCGIEDLSRESIVSKTDTVLWHLGLKGGTSSVIEFKLTRAIERACRKHGLDAVHFPATRIPLPRVKARAILTFFDMQYAFLPQFFKAEEAAAIDKSYRESVRKAECVIAPTRFTMDLLREKYGVLADKMALIPAGIDDSLGLAKKEEIEQVRGKYGLTEPYIIYPANPWPHKNHEKLLQAMKLLLASKVNVPRLVLTGRLPGKEDILRNLIRELGLTKHVSDLGYVSKRDVEVLISGAVLLIFPSLFEGFGYPVLEAMACGCPVASANSTCLPELVGDAGLLFDPGTPESIVSAIEKLAVRKAGAENLIQKGLVRADLYRWSKLVPVLEEVYSRFEGKK